MPLSKTDQFLKEIISYVKFSFDRENISLELEGHIIDRINDYAKEGYNIEMAEQMAINAMGDAKVIGIEMNKQHHPVIGWLLKITNIIMALVSILVSFFVILPILTSIYSYNPINDIPEDNIVYRIDIDEKAKIDDRVIHFTNLIYEKDGTMNILYKTYNTKLLGTGWSFGNVGIISDNLGNTYYGGSGSSGGILSRSICVVDDFPQNASKLVIEYDRYNRKYKIKIPLQAGDNNE